MSLTTLIQPVNDFAVACLFGARSVASFVENAAVRARSEDGGIGMQAAIISGGLVIIAIGIAALMATRASEADQGLGVTITTLTTAA